MYHSVVMILQAWLTRFQKIGTLQITCLSLPCSTPMDLEASCRTQQGMTLEMSTQVSCRNYFVILLVQDLSVPFSKETNSFCSRWRLHADQCCSIQVGDSWRWGCPNLRTRALVTLDPRRARATLRLSRDVIGFLCGNTEDKVFETYKCWSDLQHQWCNYINFSGSIVLSIMIHYDLRRKLIFMILDLARIGYACW